LVFIHSGTKLYESSAKADCAMLPLLLASIYELCCRVKLMVTTTHTTYMGSIKKNYAICGGGDCHL